MTTMPKRVLTPSDDHPITIEPASARVVVRFGDTIVADTNRALTLREAHYRPVQYVPVADVDASLLRSSAKQTYCPYKGDCSYFGIDTSRDEIADAVWMYRQPYPAVGVIAGHVAFYPHLVEIVVG